MSTTTNRLTAIAGLCAAAAGAIFIGVQINHPPADVAHLVTTEMTIRETAKVLFCVLALAGFTGMFAPPPRPARPPRARRLRAAERRLPRHVRRRVHRRLLPPDGGALEPRSTSSTSSTAAMGHGPSGGIGAMHELFLVCGIGYSLGGLLFGIALFRAGVLARWASVLLAYGTVSALALAVLPESFSRPFAVPTGVALIGLGVSLWRDQRRQADTVDAPATTWVAQPVTR